MFAALLAPVVAPLMKLLPARAAAKPVFKGIERDMAVMDLIEARMEAAYLQMQRIIEDDIRLNGWSAGRPIRVLGPECLTEYDFEFDSNKYVTYGSAPRNGPLV